MVIDPSSICCGGHLTCGRSVVQLDLFRTLQLLLCKIQQTCYAVIAKPHKYLLSVVEHPTMYSFVLVDAEILYKRTQDEKV